MIGSIYDGIQRPLDRLAAMEGDFITRGAFAPALDRDKTWAFKPVLKEGDVVRGGDVIGIVDETEIMEHRILVPPGLLGTLKAIYEGDFTVTDIVAIVEDEQQETHELTMMQRCL